MVEGGMKYEIYMDANERVLLMLPEGSLHYSSAYHSTIIKSLGVSLTDWLSWQLQ